MRTETVYISPVQLGRLVHIAGDGGTRLVIDRADAARLGRALIAATEPGAMPATVELSVYEPSDTEPPSPDHRAG